MHIKKIKFMTESINIILAILVFLLVVSMIFNQPDKSMVKIAALGIFILVVNFIYWNNESYLKRMFFTALLISIISYISLIVNYDKVTIDSNQLNRVSDISYEYETKVEFAQQSGINVVKESAVLKNLQRLSSKYRLVDSLCGEINCSVTNDEFENYYKPIIININDNITILNQHLNNIEKRLMILFKEKNIRNETFYIDGLGDLRLDILHDYNDYAKYNMVAKKVNMLLTVAIWLLSVCLSLFLFIDRKVYWRVSRKQWLDLCY